MSEEPTVAVMPPHAEFCDWSLSDGPCNCGLDDFVAVMVAQARREGAAEVTARVEAVLDRRRDELIYPTTSNTSERTMLVGVAAVRAALQGDA